LNVAFALRARIEIVDECFCLIPDEEDNCVTCGKPIDFQEIGELPNLGDILGMIRLIDETAKSYLRLVNLNTDPNDPELPRMRLIGGVIVRIPHKILYKKFFNPSYNQAKELGYRGSLTRWGEILQEAIGVS
jgi:hypothetical protein